MTVAPYYSKRFGCVYPKKLILLDVIYGNEADNCVLKKETAMKYVKKTCTNYSCEVRASDYFFGSENPCKEKRSISKKAIVKYQCVQGIFFFNIVLVHKTTKS